MMRLPWGKFERIGPTFLDQKKFLTLGCLSFEERSSAIAGLCTNTLPETHVCSYLFKATGPEGAYPDRSNTMESKINSILQLMDNNHYNYCLLADRPLVSSEDDLLDLFSEFKNKVEDEYIDTVVLDISTMPKRFFCLLLKRFLITPFPRNLVITYTQPNSYPPEDTRLAEDIMPCSNLPGFSSPTEDGSDTMVISVGLEEFNLLSLREVRPTQKLKILMSFPPDGSLSRRQWRVIRRITEDDTSKKYDIEVVPTLDVEQVYFTLRYWEDDSSGLVLAPFGPKTHSLGMTLFACKYERSMYYTQPRSYNPDYSAGIGETWCYVTKWDGIKCFDRDPYGV